jgi:hypothetical protein
VLSLHCVLISHSLHTGTQLNSACAEALLRLSAPLAYSPTHAATTTSTNSSSVSPVATFRSIRTSSTTAGPWSSIERLLPAGFCSAVEHIALASLTPPASPHLAVSPTRQQQQQQQQNSPTWQQLQQHQQQQQLYLASQSPSTRAAASSTAVSPPAAALSPTLYRTQQQQQRSSRPAERAYFNGDEHPGESQLLGVLDGTEGDPTFLNKSAEVSILSCTSSTCTASLAC